MILRLVVGLKVACPGFATTGVNTESRRSLLLEADVGETKAEFICMGVTVEGVEVDSCTTTLTDDVLDVDGETCIKLISKDCWGDSGFEGCASVVSKSARNC